MLLVCLFKQVTQTHEGHRASLPAKERWHFLTDDGSQRHAAQTSALCSHPSPSTRPSLQAEQPGSALQAQRRQWEAPRGRYVASSAPRGSLRFASHQFQKLFRAPGCGPSRTKRGRALSPGRAAGTRHRGSSPGPPLPQRNPSRNARPPARSPPRPSEASPLPGRPAPPAPAPSDPAPQRRPPRDAASGAGAEPAASILGPARLGAHLHAGHLHRHGRVGHGGLRRPGAARCSLLSASLLLGGGGAWKDKAAGSGFSAGRAPSFPPRAAPPAADSPRWGRGAGAELRDAGGKGSPSAALPCPPGSPRRPCPCPPSRSRSGDGGCSVLPGWRLSARPGLGSERHVGPRAGGGGRGGGGCCAAAASSVSAPALWGGAAAARASASLPPPPGRAGRSGRAAAGLRAWCRAGGDARPAVGPCGAVTALCPPQAPCGSAASPAGPVLPSAVPTSTATAPVPRCPLCE